MKRYCFDNSGFSNPHETMPEDIPAFATLWDQLTAYVLTGEVAVTTEIYEEMCHIPGVFGQCLKNNQGQLLMEVGDPSWDSLSYINHFKRMQESYAPFLSEYSHGGSKKTIGLKDLTIISLAKALTLPVVSMEKSAMPSASKRRIPDICDDESVLHYSFNDFLRLEGIGK